MIKGGNGFFMISRLLGKKLGMTRFFLENGACVPVTVIKVGPCVVIQKKSKEKDGYNAIQLGFEPKKESRVNKPLIGHFKKAGKGSFAFLKEVRVDNVDEFELGQEIKAEMFKVGDVVNVSGKTKGRGFAGAMKRWGFSGGAKTHGSRSHRIPGSIGMCATPGRVLKGHKMPGRMGNKRVTVKNLKIVDVRPDVNIVLISGAVPGSRNGLVEIHKVNN